jgi:Right handed beta helix region
VNCPPGARKAILGVANVTSATTHDITFSNLTMLADVKPLIFAASQIDGFHLSNITAHVGNLLTVGDMHHLEIDHCHITDWDGTGEAFGAKGVSGVLVHDNSWEGLTSLAIQANEGTSDLKVHNNTFTTSGAPTSPAWNNVMGMRSRCHNVSITGNTFVNDIGAPIIRADPGCERVEVLNNVFSDQRAVNAGVLPGGSIVKGNHIQAPLKPIVDFQGHVLSNGQ